MVVPGHPPRVFADVTPGPNPWNRLSLLPRGSGSTSTGEWASRAFCPSVNGCQRTSAIRRPTESQPWIFLLGMSWVALPVLPWALVPSTVATEYWPIVPMT
jgi:hypothetical protein